jgi:DNA-binding NtrC family response regulator
MQMGRSEVDMTNSGDLFLSGKVAATQALESAIAEIAPTNIPVLLIGESGTGKQVFARRIHSLSMGSEKALVEITCASMTAELLSDRLGLNSVSGRASASIGVGTVLFDEVSELESASQRSLLSALPDGDSRPRPGLLTARLISTTSRNLDDEVRARRFRSELYYRINGVCLRLPPLRERKEDIPRLVDFFLAKHATQFGRPRFSLSPETLRAFVDHSWPGNIRELENAVRNIVALNDEHLAVSELVQARTETRAAEVNASGNSLKVAARAASREAERELILKALARTRWNRKRAAQELQISYKSLLYKLKQIGLQETEAS